VVPGEGVEEEKVFGIAETVFDGVVASWNVVGDDSGDLIKRDITYAKSPYKLGYVLDGLLMRLGG
jgi:hypothetical protein